MHIPEGYLSPKTCGILYAAMAPIWYLAARKVQKTLHAKQIPLLALSAAFTFVIMMFNIPIPGGSTGHMVGGVIVACVLGPWAAVISISTALVIQALLFGDGGITPVGLLAKGTAWGEWATEELKAIFGYAPEGMRSLEGLWISLLPDYNIPVFNNPLLGYIFSAAIGSSVIMLIIYLAGKIWKRG